MIDDEIRAKIMRLYHSESWPIATVAKELGIHHATVERVLRHEGTPAIRAERATMLDPYLPFILDTLDRHPKLHASRLYDMCIARGYPGGQDHFRALVRRVRPKPSPEAFLRLSALPGSEAQMDWGHFGRVVIGRSRRQLIAFVIVLSWSRMIFLRFFLGSPMECFLRGHVEGLAAFGGTPRVMLYDNLKSAVTERRGDAISFNPQLLALSAHYHFEPRPVAVARGNEKGRVERAIRFVRDSFFAARIWTDLDDLNRQAAEWTAGRAAQRPWADDKNKTVGQAFVEEQSKLLALPGDPFPTERIEQVSVGKTPYVRFDTNDYSVPHKHVRKTLTVAASEVRIRILDGQEVLCEHERSYDKAARIEDSEHVKDLINHKRSARRSLVKDRLVRAAPSTAQLFEELATRGVNLGSQVTALLKLLEKYGAKRLESAVCEALERSTPECQSVRLVLEREQMERGLKPAIAVDLPDDERVRDLTVRPGSLADYLALTGDGADSEKAVEGDDARQ